VLAEVEEAADLVTEFSEGLVIDAVVGHGYIVSRYYCADQLEQSECLRNIYNSLFGTPRQTSLTGARL
jgi:hypothetical protein